RRTTAYFGPQQVSNRVLSEGAKPLSRIEELDALLTKTSLRRLPLWALGTNDVLEDIADQLNDGSAMVAYEQGLRALAIRNYPAAARYLAAAEQRGLRLPATTPLRAYALCLADQCDAA